MDIGFLGVVGNTNDYKRDKMKEFMEFVEEKRRQGVNVEDKFEMYKIETDFQLRQITEAHFHLSIHVSMLVERIEFLEKQLNKK